MVLSILLYMTHNVVFLKGYNLANFLLHSSTTKMHSLEKMKSLFWHSVGKGVE